MCLGVPGQVIRIEENVATVDFWGTRRNVRIEASAGRIVEGDYVIEHAGVIERKISEQDVLDTLTMYETLMCDAGCDVDSLADLVEDEVLV